MVLLRESANDPKRTFAASRETLSGYAPTLFRKRKALQFRPRFANSAPIQKLSRRLWPNKIF